MLERISLILGVVTMLVGLLGGFRVLWIVWRAWRLRRIVPRWCLILVCAGVFWGMPTQGHTFAWSGIIDAPRAFFDWVTAGAVIVNRTTNCSTAQCNTLFAGTVTSASIAAAISSAPAETVIRIPAGVFTLSAGIDYGSKNNVTLRGQGPDSTRLNITGTLSCGPGYNTDVCVDNTAPNCPSTAACFNGPVNTATWTAVSYAQGQTQITLTMTLGSLANLHVGSQMILDQLDDSNTDTGEVWICATAGICSQEGNSDGQLQRPGRNQQQTVVVTNIAGSDVTFAPGLAMPNWRASQSPGAWFSSAPPVTGVGLEDLFIDETNGSTGDLGRGILFYLAANSWVKNVKTINGPRCAICLFSSSHLTVRDSYLWGTQTTLSQSYGIEYWEATQTLVENNIFQNLTAPMMLGTAAVGNVLGYNYSIHDNYSVVAWMLSGIWNHAGGASFQLVEGNVGSGTIADNIHGQTNFNTYFRDYFTGWEAGKTLQTVAINNMGFNRFYNYIGNVLGMNTYHNNYTSATPNATNCNLSIYALGWGGNCGTGTVADDTIVAADLMRWGNYDTVNDANRFVNAEVPTGIAKYPNSIPVSQTLPASFYLSAKPSWMGVAGQPTIPFPAVGPDVTGQVITASEGSTAWVAQVLNGHAAPNAAMLCYKEIMGGPADGSGADLTFNANNCYTGSTPPPPPPVTAILPYALGRVLHWFEVLLPVIGLGWHFRRALMASLLLAVTWTTTVSTITWITAKTRTRQSALVLLTTFNHWTREGGSDGRRLPSLDRPRSDQYPNDHD